MNSNNLNGRLKNGMSYYIYKTQSKEIKYSILNRIDITKEKDSGISHLLEHMNLAYPKYNKKDWIKNNSNIINPNEYKFFGYTDFDRVVLRLIGRNDEGSLKNALFLIKKMILGEMLNKDVLEEVKSEVIGECDFFKERNRFQEKVISLITEGKLNMLPMGKKELISKHQVIKYKKSKVIIDKKNIDENDYFILIYKLNDLIDIDKIHIDIIKELVEKGFENEEYVVQVTILKNTLIQISLEEVEVNSEDICTEFIDNFFEDKAIILVKDQCNEVIKNIDSINLEDINKLVLRILNNYCKIVLSEGKYNK